MYDRCLIDFGLIFKDCRAHFAPKFHAKEPWDELCDYFELILGSCRGIGEVVGSLMLENRSQNEGNQAAHLHFDTKRGSANLLKADFGIILRLFWDHGGTLERWWGA